MKPFSTFLPREDLFDNENLRAVDKFALRGKTSQVEFGHDTVRQATITVSPRTAKQTRSQRISDTFDQTVSGEKEPVQGVSLAR